MGEGRHRYTVVVTFLQLRDRDTAIKLCALLSGAQSMQVVL